MENISIQGNHSQVTWIIKAPRMEVYQAFLDPQAVAVWLAPEDMQARVHHFEPYEGGKFRISLMYTNHEDSGCGKTTGNLDTYHGRFAQLIPGELIEEIVEFETEDAKFTGEMKMIARLVDVTAGTEVTMRFENMPPGIRPEDNENGSLQSLKKLAKLLEK